MQSNANKKAKNGKRSVFRSSAVLTALIVILLVFAALTTATFAWFSSNRSVTAGTTEFTANNSDGAGDVKIYWGADENGSGLSITMKDMVNMQPTTPVSKLQEGDGLAAARFQTAIQNGEGAEATFASVATVATDRLVMLGDTATDPTQEKDFFTVANTGSAAIASSFRMKAVFGDLQEYPNSDIIRIAVFVASDNPTLNSSYKYCGTLGYGNNTDTFYGEIVEDALVSSQSKYAATTSVDLVQGLALNGRVYVKLLAWFDGNQLTVSRAGGKAQVTLSIELVG